MGEYRGDIPTWIGRQPLFDAQMDVRAYQLLAARSGDDGAAAPAPDVAARFWTTFIELGLEEVSERQPAYLAVDRDFLLADCATLFADERVAFEIPADLPLDPTLRSCIDRLVRDGYRFVLDDFRPAAEPAPEMLALASGVKIDAADEEGLEFLSRRVGTLHRQGISVIAKNVDTRERFERCVSLGADRYQGQFLQEPERLESGELPVDQIARLELLSVVNDPEAGLDRFESAISKDITLSYKLLRYINSAMFSLQREIGSIRHAVTMLGIRWTRTWSNLVILSAVADRPQAVVTSAMVRAKMCEQLARRLGCAEPESHFTAGLLSMLDVFLGQDMHRILERLPLEDGLRDALLEGTGERGVVLEAARAYERSIWEEAVCPGLAPGDLRDAYLEALIFARDTRRFLGELAPAA